MQYFEFKFDVKDIQESETLIALLSDIGFEAFEEQENELKSYIKSEDFNEILFNNLIKENSLNYCKTIIKEKNWNEVWESGFEPINVYHPINNEIFVHVRADFHPPYPEVKYDLLITPKMSFGTGHHATTFQMIQQMALIDFKGMRVIDFGSGTGLLSILAEKMGAESIIAIDNDIWSINNSKENIEANQCQKIEVKHTDKCQEFDCKSDIILANINLNVIVSNLNNIINSCIPNGFIIFSGILKEDETKIVSFLENNSVKIISYSQKDNWLVLVCKTPN